MPPPAILDPATLDLDQIVADREEIQRHNPQRHEFGLLDAVVLLDQETKSAAGYHDVREDGWWTRGHIPGRPLFPGVLMIELAAQLVSFMTHHFYDVEGFIGFAGVDGAKFRGAVVPGERLVVIGRIERFRKRRADYQTQGFVGNTMVFEAGITGMVL